MWTNNVDQQDVNSLLLSLNHVGKWDFSNGMEKVNYTPHQKN